MGKMNNLSKTVTNELELSVRSILDGRADDPFFLIGFPVQLHLDLTFGTIHGHVWTLTWGDRLDKIRHGEERNNEISRQDT